MSVTYRQGEFEDSQACSYVVTDALLDLSQRIGAMAITGGLDPDVPAQLWERRSSLFEHLARTGDQWWIAERDGKMIGYARSILRDDVRELTEFFVLPNEQSAGVGRELLARTFPTEGAAHRTIVATADSRAMARYLKSGVYARFPIYYFSRQAEAVSVETDLTFGPITACNELLSALRHIDSAIIGHTRDIDHAWLMVERSGYVYYRAGEPVGYGYVGKWSGPFALLDDADFPAVLAHAESVAAESGGELGVEVPLINRAAVDYLLGRGYQMDSFFAFFMSDQPVGKFENYLLTSPPFFL